MMRVLLLGFGLAATACASGTTSEQCTPTGGECGDGDACTADGHCVHSGNPGMEPDTNCPSLHFTATKTMPAIQLLIDRSGSMLHDFADEKTSDPALRKYAAEVDALVG